jgi:hypothetical protein
MTFEFYTAITFCTSGQHSMTSIAIIVGAIFLIGILFAIFFPSGNSLFTERWEQLPTKEQYVRTHPETADGQHVKCYYCRAFNTLDVGLANITDYRRTIICRSCKRQLWREQG